jgi:hypothetical protein
MDNHQKWEMMEDYTIWVKVYDAWKHDWDLSSFIFEKDSVKIMQQKVKKLPVTRLTPLSMKTEK